MTPKRFVANLFASTPVPFRRKPKYARLGIEYLEDRTMLDATLPPDLIVGRTLSTYSTTGIANNTLTVTYTVYNETANDITGVLLTDTLQPGVSFSTATILPDRNGQDLAWSLGTIHGYDRASVALTVTLPAIPPLQIDTGAIAFGTLNAGMVTGNTPAATLTTRIIPADQLASTPDANTTDPFIQEQAAKLRYDPTKIFDYLNNEVGYESYVGSLRGARGTLWSVAGNSLDEASLGVALFRASGLPARYAHGTLSDPLSQQLILSMFPATFQTVGYIPAGTPIADPANDPKLLGETRDHYWLQVDTGAGFVDADSSGLGGVAIGTAYTTATSTFTEVADALRHKVEVKLDAEIYTQLSAAFGVGDGLSRTMVLDRTFNSVDLVGRFISISNLVAQSGIPGLVFTSQTTTYTPYIAIGDQAFPEIGQPEAIFGNQYQEVLTNFPLGNQLLTGLFLKISLTEPGGQSQEFDRALFDRIGYAARNGLGGSVSVDPNGPPAFTPLDVFTFSILSSNQSTAAEQLLRTRAEQEIARLAGETNPPTLSQTRVLLSLARSILAEFTVASDQESANLSRGYDVAAYLNSPRITLFSSKIVTANNQSNITFGMDLVRDSLRVLAAPGQSAKAPLGYSAVRGVFDSHLESQVLPILAGSTNLSSANIIQQARQQGIPLITIDPSNIATLQTLNLPAVAIARITTQIQNGNVVVVPTQEVTINGTTVTAWYVVNPTTGEVLSQGLDGSYQGITTMTAIYAIIIGASLNVFLTELGQFGDYLQGHPHPHEAQELVKSAILGGLGFLIPFTPVGLLGALAYSLLTSFWAPFVWIQQNDPPVSNLIVDANLPFPNMGLPTTRAEMTAPANMIGGQVSGVVTTPHVSVTGRLSATWTGAANSNYIATSFGSSEATITNSQGVILGSGIIAISNRPAFISIVGNTINSITGQGSLTSYGPAESTLGINGNWDNYIAAVSGNITLTVTTDAMTLNGQLLPAGTYSIATSNASLTGSGATSSPNFAGSAAITATNGTLSLGSGSGTVSVGGNALSLANGATLTGYTGNLTITAGGPGNVPDNVTLSGNAANVLTVSTNPATVTADQNTPVTVPVVVNTSLADNYDLTAEAPLGWTVSFDNAGNLTVTPAAGLQSGTVPIRIVARSKANPNLVAQTTLTVNVTATAPGITFNVSPDTLFTVPYSGAQIPSAFRANVRNLGPTADTYSLTTTNLPAGFTLQSSGNSVRVPAGQTGLLGLYLVPNGGTLPAPGTVITFDVTATSTTNPVITQSQHVTFTMPEVHAVTLASAPSGFAGIPGGTIAGSVTITAVGNVPEVVTLSNTTSTGVTLNGLPTSVSLNPGETRTLPYNLAIGSGVALNSTLQTTITATVGPTATPTVQTLQLQIRVTAPGADAIASAAYSAGQAGNVDLANRLNDLATALTTLFLTPTDSVSRGQSVASLTAIARLLDADPFLRTLSSGLAGVAAQLAAATTTAEVQAAITATATALAGLDQRLTEKAQHAFELYLPTNTATALPGVAALYVVGLRNIGSVATTYDITVVGLPSGVTASFDEPSVTLQPGEARVGGADPIVLSLTQATGSVLPASFTVVATARLAPNITLSTGGVLTVRAESVTVPIVTATPPFSDPGAAISVSARVLSVVNATRSVLASFVVRAPGGAIVFTSNPVPVTLTVQAGQTIVALGSFDTTGYAIGDYSIDVTIANANGTPIAGATGQGRVQIGLPASGNLSVSAGTGLRAEYFDLATSPSVLPDLTGLIPDVVRIDAVLNFPSSSGAFTGLDNRFIDTFAARYTGFVNIATTGNYTFYLGSDDGSKLWIDGTLVVNNDGGHAFREFSNTINLTAGFHTVRIEFFEGFGDAGLILKWSGPGIAKQVVPTEVLSVIAVPVGPIATLPQGNGIASNQLTVTGRANLASPLTFAGQVATTPSSTTIALRGTLAYVAGTNGIDIVDATNPANPVRVSTFGQGQIVQGGIAIVRALGADKIIVGTSVSNNGSGFSLLIYSVTDPLNPTLISNTLIPRSFLQDMIVSGNLVIVPLGWIFNGSSFGGDVVAVDVSDPANPFETDILFSNGPGVFVGPSFNTGGIPISPTITYIGSNRNNVDSRVLVVDSSNPAALTNTELTIPGTAWIADIARQGDLVLVVGSGPTVANITLNVLDATNPASPVIRGTLVTGVSRVSGTVQTLGNGLFAVGGATLDGSPVLLLVDPTNPDNIVVSTIPVPAAINEVQVSGNLLYVATATGLLIYNIGTFETAPFTASVRVPKGTGVAIVPGSFNVPPSRTITTDPNFDMLEWDRTFAFGQSQFTFTWQTTVTGLAVGETRPVTVGTTVNFTANATPGTFDLPSTTVLAATIAGLAPAARTVQPGASSAFTLNLSNPSNSPVTYTLSLGGVPAEWGSLTSSITLAAGATADVPLTLSPSPSATLADYGFVVNVVGNNGSRGAAEGTLTVAGAVVPTDANSHGVVVAITPTQATAGVGNPAYFVVRVTNTGSVTETFDLAETDAFGFGNEFSLTTVTVPPGAGNFREVKLAMTPALGATAGNKEFRVTVTSRTPGTTGSVDATVTVVTNGVGIQLDRASGLPGETFQATVTNRGTTTDTFNLSLGDAGGLVANLGVNAVTLAPGASTTVPITTGSASFAALGTMPLSVVARSAGNPAVADRAEADLVIPPAIGLTANFDPASKVVAAPGTTDFLLLVQNTGNTEEIYTATLIGTTGPVTATLIGLDGLPTQTVPTFRLPGLATGALLVRVTLGTAGAGTVTVRVQSLVNNLTTTSTATVNPAPVPVVVPVAPAATTPATLAVVIPPVDVPLPPAGPNHFYAVGAGAGISPIVRLYNATTGAVRFEFLAYDASFTGGVVVAVADFDQDGFPDVVTAAGPGGGPHVKVFSGRDLTLLASFFAYASDFSGGVYVAAGDLNGDGIPEIVTGTGDGGGPLVRTFRYDAGTISQFDGPLGNFLAYAATFRGGVTVAIGDIDGDGRADILTGAGAGGGSHIQVWNANGQSIQSFFAYNLDFHGGVFVAAGDLNGDGKADIVTGAGASPGGGPHVEVFRDGKLVSNFFAYAPYQDASELWSGGVRVGVSAGLDGKPTILTGAGAGPGGGPHIRRWNPKTLTEADSVFAFDPSFQGGVFVGSD